MTDGAVLPVLHLNGYKIANPAVLARIPDDEPAALMRGYGYRPHFVAGDDPAAVHRQLAATLDEVLDAVAAIQHDARDAAGPRGRGRGRAGGGAAGKQPALTYLSMEQAIAHCTRGRGLGIWPWAGTTDGEPDVVLGCAGDIPTLEILAAADLLRTHLPELKVPVINVVDIMRLEPDTEHPHGLPDRDFDALFTSGKPVIFAYHGYPWLIHRLTYRRTNHRNLHVRGTSPRSCSGGSRAART